MLPILHKLQLMIFWKCARCKFRYRCIRYRWRYLDCVSPPTLPNGSIRNTVSVKLITASGGTSPYSFLGYFGRTSEWLNVKHKRITFRNSNRWWNIQFHNHGNRFQQRYRKQRYTVFKSLPAYFCDDFEDGVLDPNWTYHKAKLERNQVDALVGTPSGKESDRSCHTTFFWLHKLQLKP